MPGIGIKRLGVPSGGGSLTPLVFPLGDSYTVGLRGDTGGWRSRMVTPGWTGVGPHTDPTARKHAGVGGETLNDMDARVAAQLAAYPHQEIWLHGGSNDMLGGNSAATTEADLTTLLTTIYGAVPASRVTRIGSLPPVDAATDATIDPYNMRLAKVVAAQRALGRRVYLHDSGDHLVVGDLDATPTKHPVDGTYGTGGSGYGKWAAFWDRWFTPSLAKAPNEVTGTLEFWFRADDVTLSGSRVTQANDKSGNARHAAEVSSSGPAYTASGTTWPLAPCMTFNGTDDYLKTGSSWTLSQPTTICCVAGPVTNGNAKILLDAATAAARNVLWAPTTTPFGLYAGSSAADPYLLYSNAGHLYIAEFNGASSRVIVDGNLRRSNTYSPGAQGLNGVTLGASLTPSNYAAVEIYEAWGYSGTLSEADLFALAMYCRNRYGLWPLLGG